MRRFISDIKSKLSNKQGVSAIEIVVGCLIFLMLMCFMTDIAVLTWKFSAISQTNTHLARTVGLQGGALASAPQGFPGGNAAYASKTEIYNTIKENLNKAGIKDGEFKVMINNSELRAQNKEVDYRDFLTTTIELDYKWDMTSNFVPGSITNKLKSKRSSISEFKYRYDTWIGE